MLNGSLESSKPPVCFKPRCEACLWRKLCANSAIPPYITFTWTSKMNEWIELVSRKSEDEW